MESELHQTLESGGLTHEDATERVKQKRRPEDSGEKRAAHGLIVDAHRGAGENQINDERAGGRRVAAIVTQSGRNRDRAPSSIARKKIAQGLRQSMRREKALDFILSRAQREDTVKMHHRAARRGFI